MNSANRQLKIQTALLVERESKIKTLEDMVTQFTNVKSTTTPTCSVPKLHQETNKKALSLSQFKQASNFGVEDMEDEIVEDGEIIDDDANPEVI